ncbi:HlyD family secretion protein [Pseudoduganella violacea]|uniref:Membrane fusion protein n=1 Tax=Pseudoduganella violacea TaxID=1715466 RepID=A0A7W5FVQ8_9BURK|nr:HlyD family efflux transporter periplasmic adaptor subunit [Pseudoduganella violacea]MBB3121072.1 membrane fusion protein [Pseudoduganella violacea]
MQEKNTSLFRHELFESRQNQWLGSIQLSQPISAALVVALSVALGTLAIIYIAFGTITKKAHVSGITTPAQGIINVTSKISGIISHIHATEGQEVSEGDLLFDISSDRHTSLGDVSLMLNQQFSVRQESLEKELYIKELQMKEKKQSLKLRLKNLDLEDQNLTQELKILESRRNLANLTENKYSLLEKNGFISSTQTQEKKEISLDLASKEMAMKRSKQQLQSSKIALEEEISSISSIFEMESSQIRRAIAGIKQEIIENQDKLKNLSNATKSGVISNIMIKPGQSVSAGQLLASIVPFAACSQVSGGKNLQCQPNKNIDLEVHLYASSKATGFVTPGQTVMLRYQAYPYQKFGLRKGTVVDVSSTPFAPNELPANMASTILSYHRAKDQNPSIEEALYRIRVKIDVEGTHFHETSFHLKPGMVVDADIIQDNRRIWEWILEPAIAMSKRI